MTQRTEAAERLYRWWELTLEQDNCQRDLDHIKEQLPQAKHQKRETEAALLEYDGSLKAFFDKCSGKFEEKRERLARNVSSAAAELQSTLLHLERAEGKLEKVRLARQDLGQPEDYPACLDDLAPEERNWVLRKETEVYVNRILPLLHTARESLEQAQEWARPQNRIDVAPGYTEGILLSRAEKSAEDCRECLLDLQRCEIQVEIHPYFENPSGYINGVASQYGKLDRINSALGAIARTEKTIKERSLSWKEES